MTKFVALCVRLGCSALLVLLLASAVRAQDLPEPTSYLLHHGADGGWLECDGTVDCTRTPGKRGVWFELGVAETLVREHRAYAELAATLSATEQKVQLGEKRLSLCKDSESLAIAAAAGAEAAIDDAVTQKRDAEDRAEAAIASRDAWYNAKLLWYSGGLLTALAILGGAMVIAN